MDVSPSDGGTITSPDFSTPVITYPKTYTCSYSYTLTAVANSASNYKFDHWEGGASGSEDTVTVSVLDGEKSVTAYFSFKTEGVSLQETKNLLDGGKDILVLDVSAATDYTASHMLCAKNYIWNSTTNSFTTPITPLNAYTEKVILVYDENGTKSGDAADYLAEQGFASVYYMTDGLDDWIAEGYETFTTDEDAGVCTSLPPMAYAGADQEVNENATVTLQGQGSDPDGGSITFAWSQVQGAHNVVLSSTSQAQPSFTAPDLNGGDDTLIFHLTVTDDDGDSDSDSVQIIVNNEDGSTIPVNNAPTADAGADQSVEEDNAVTLDGTGSADSDGSIATYAWAQTDNTGISVSLSSKTAENPTFTAPDVASDTTLSFALVVTDNDGETSSADTVQVTITAGSGDSGCFISSMAI